MSLLQVKFHSSVSTFPQKPFLFTPSKFFEKLHSAGETRNFETKFIISIHLSYFQSYHGVQMQLNSYFLAEKHQELCTRCPIPLELGNLVA